MLDVAFDIIACAYDDFGVDAYINGVVSPVKLLKDEGLQFDDSSVLVVRAMASTNIVKTDSIELDGTIYKVMKVTSFGDQHEENLISLAAVDA